jgi:hypothetical protein
MFKVRGFPRKNLKWWFSQESFIDLDPDFQRTGQVWKDLDRAFLIDSILNGYDVPKIYIADFSTHDIPALNKHKKKYAVIDGKQRLTAAFAFFRDKLPLAKKFKLESNPSLALGGLRYTELKKKHREVARLVEKFVLDIKVIETSDRRRIHDVFLRLNKASKALNGAEVRNAIIGRCVDAIRDLGKHRFFRQKIRFPTNRSQEKNATAKMLLLEYHGPSETKKKNLDAFVLEIGEAGSGRFNKTVARTRRNLDVMARVFKDQDALLGAQGHIALYYLFISRLRANELKSVRDFLVAFEAKRRKNRARNRLSQAGDAQLDAFDLTSRSTNDKSSLESRLKIIRSRHKHWKAHKQI